MSGRRLPGTPPCGADAGALYADIDLELSWSERDLPERERTKHVHRLHPYLGKFIPQLVETLLARHVPPRGRVLDPFAGSGTTLVQSLESGRAATGVDIAAFNCLLSASRPRGTTSSSWRRRSATRSRPPRPASRDGPGPWLHRTVVRAAGGRRAARLPLAGRRLRARRRPPGRARPRRAVGAADDALRPRLPARAAGRARTGATSTGASAARSSGPSTSSAATRSTRSRGSRRSRASVTRGARRRSCTATRASSELGRAVRRRRHLAAVPGADRLPRAAPLRLRAARARRPARARGRRRRRRDEQGRARRVLAGDRRRAARTFAARCVRARPVAIVVNDRRDLYPEILERAGLRLEHRLRRHVNRRTGVARASSSKTSLVARACAQRFHTSSRFAFAHSVRLPAIVLARTVTHALVGLDARRVEVEAHVELGGPGFTIVGLADRACQEAKHRVRSGIASAELELADRRRITVNLAPAGAAQGGLRASTCRSRSRCSAPRARFPTERLAAHAAVGELALDGRVRPVGGVLAAAEGAHAGGRRAAPLRRPSRRRRPRSPGSSRCRSRHLAEAAAYLRGETRAAAVRAAGERRARRRRTPTSPTSAARSERAVRSRSPPPAGTTCCSPARRARARRCSRAGCPGCCRRLAPDEALEVTRIHSVAGLLAPDDPARPRPALPRAAPQRLDGGDRRRRAQRHGRAR